MPKKPTPQKKPKKTHKGQNRPSEIRLSGVPPIMPIKTKTKKTKKTTRKIRLSGKKKNKKQRAK